MSRTDFPTMERCRLHDVILDEDTDECDVCQAESDDCPHCEGDGVIVTTHPQWGQLNCPEPFVETQCGYCAGTGLKDGGT